MAALAVSVRSRPNDVRETFWKTWRGAEARQSRPGFLFLARKVGQVLAARGQFGLLDDQYRKTVSNGKPQAAPIANKVVALQAQPGSTGIHGTAKDFEQVRANHRGSSVDSEKAVDAPRL